MNKSEVIKTLLSDAKRAQPVCEIASAFAPTNIALCKYWGKRDTELNLPVTSSLSIALPNKGCLTHLSVADSCRDTVILNGHELDKDSNFVARLTQFLNLFRPQQDWFLKVNITMTVPVAAGLASSACGFAALVLAMNELFAWKLTLQQLSILARLGSGSATRSLWQGFVEWQAGSDVNGMDSYATPLNANWPSLCVGILPISAAQKPISSREAMLRTVNTSLLYQAWPERVAKDMQTLKQAIADQNFALLGQTAEMNALNMHATMLASWPPVCYSLPETVKAMHQVWALRAQGCELYFTQDAGPNLKLLFERDAINFILPHFPDLEVISLF